MDWLLQLLAHESVARTVLILAVAIATGTALGKIKVGGVTLGVAGVLFTSLTPTAEKQLGAMARSEFGLG